MCKISGAVSLNLFSWHVCIISDMLFLLHICSIIPFLLVHLIYLRNVCQDQDSNPRPNGMSHFARCLCITLIRGWPVLGVCKKYCIKVVTFLQQKCEMIMENIFHKILRCTSYFARLNSAYTVKLNRFSFCIKKK